MKIVSCVTANDSGFSLTPILSHKDAVIEAYRHELEAAPYAARTDILDTLLIYLESPHEHSPR